MDMGRTAGGAGRHSCVTASCPTLPTLDPVTAGRQAAPGGPAPSTGLLLSHGERQGGCCSRGWDLGCPSVLSVVWGRDWCREDTGEGQLEELAFVAGAVGGHRHMALVLAAPLMRGDQAADAFGDAHSRQDSSQAPGRAELVTRGSEWGSCGA